MRRNSFLLNHAEFDFEDGERRTISFLGENADQDNTHITIIAGANGTSKSRLVANIVEQFCEINNAQRDKPKDSRRYQRDVAQGLTCTGFSTFRNRQLSQYSTLLDQFSPSLDKNGVLRDRHVALPSRVLVLSNLVMDKFHFQKDGSTDDQFYHYLGVRQSSNLTTTGSVERSVSEALIDIVADRQRLDLFRSWLELVFPGGRELAFEFPRLSRSNISKFLEAKNRTEFIKLRIERPAGNVMRNVTDETIEKTTNDITELFEFLDGNLSDYDTSSLNARQKSRLFLRLATLTDTQAAKFARLIPCFSSAQRAGFSSWPSLCFEAKSWLPFHQLSSGEQNLLSVGAKLISHARPGCFVAIDEPEVSLNVAWQQKYTDLIWNSLAQATGSHVLIATHSPHLISSLPKGKASLITIQKNNEELLFKTHDALFEGWGAESVLYQVLGITSASSHLFYRDLATVLHHIQEGGTDRTLLDGFLEKANRLNFARVEPLEIVISEVVAYVKGLP